MNRPRRVCVVITARPSYARIKTALKAIQEHDGLELMLVCAASALLDRYGKVIDVIRADGFEPKAMVHMLLEGENLVTSAKSTGLGIVELASVFESLKPDVVVSVADRYETIATAIAAAYLNLPVCHVQGGEVTGSIDEKVRHAVTKLADIHCVSSDGAADRVRRMGERPEKVFVTGCPSIDIAASVMAEPADSYRVEDLLKNQGVGHGPAAEDGYLVVMQHPVTTHYDRAGEELTTTMKAVVALNRPTFWFWPNVDPGSELTAKAIRVYRETANPTNIRFLKNLPPEHFLRLLRKAGCLIGNSSVGIRECAYMGVPVINIGDRQSRRDRGPNTIDVPHDSEAIRAAAERQLAHGPYPSSDVYGDGTAGRNIADTLAAAPLDIDKQITY